MADRRRIITLSSGGRPILDLDLELTSTYQAIQDTFAYAPGQANTQTSRQTGRYGGGIVVGEQNDNGTVSWQALVRGSTPDQVAANMEALLVSGARTTRGRLFEWRPEGVSFSSYFRVAGPVSWKPTYSWKQFAGAQSMLVDVQVPVRPLVLWDRMTIGDPFDVDSRADYAFDAATSADVAVSGGALIPVVGAALTVERGARHTARGYDLLEGQATVKGTPVTTITGCKLCVWLRASAANTRVEVYVDDNGTNSRLRIDVVIAGVRTNRSTTNLAARLVTATAAWVRGRIEGNVVIAEYFAAAPTPMGAPTLTASYTLVVGDAPLHTTAGKAGWSWVPQNAGATLDDFEFRPFTYRNQTLPQKIAPSDNLPGNAPALADVTVTPSGGAAAPVFALMAWARRRAAPVAGVSPFGVIEAETAGDLTGWSVAADAASRGGSRLIDATVSGAETYTASWVIDPGALAADDFTDDEITLEVFARIAFGGTIVSPRFILSARPQQGVAFGAERFTSEWGSVGFSPAITASVNQFLRLGTLRLPTSVPMKLWLAASTAAGSSGAIAVDYLVSVLARGRALSPTAKPNDGSYPKFVASTAETSKRVRADLSALVSSPPSTALRDHGLGGSLVEPLPGAVDWLVKLSNLVPDDPTGGGTSEQLAHSATVSLDVVPRSFLLRA